MKTSTIVLLGAVLVLAACSSKNGDDNPRNGATNNQNNTTPTNNTTGTNNTSNNTSCSTDDDCAAGQICDDGDCVDGSSCGDGLVQDGETCDGAELDGATCESETGLSSGALACDADCELDSSACYECGDASIDGAEVCDGDELDGATCVALGFGGGEPTCAADCLSVDDANCWACDDGICDLALGENSTLCPADCGWVDIAVGGDFGSTHVCAVKGDGSVWCWGANASGQLGNGGFEDSATPVQVAGIEDATSVALGELHSCALGAQGDAWCWGLNIEGQLGDGSTINASTPQPVFLEHPATQLAAGRYHTCAVVDQNGLPTVFCWGSNAGGKLGDGTNENRIVPTAISPTMTAVTAGITHSCGIDAATQKANCWGVNAFGQLGDDTIELRLEPVLVAPPTGLEVLEIGAGENVSCAVLLDNTVNCWGRNTQGVLGTGPLTSTRLPVMVDGLDGIAAQQLVIGLLTSCVISEGQPYCWGDNRSGQIGNGTTDNPRPLGAVPVQLTDVATIKPGESTTCAVTDDGAAYCWGDNQNGQVGDGTTGDDVLLPAVVADPYAAP